ncbi:PREDICTED: uncharacterized protein PFB0145c-like [Polistes canadensis]|uniref:uncharacterized protein PFB0145c-like n=1 Tax=Polistes canadensis TaxID=91411 RepID=UPI00071901AC|nr:PREDICTED: uncharacterized protein PFB0145c-like [Polistes canadensis]
MNSIVLFIQLLYQTIVRERIHENNSELQRDYDEQKDTLDEVKRKEKEASIALKKSLQEQQRLLERLETAELEVLQIPNLKDKLNEITNERVESMKMNAEIVEKLEKKHIEYESLLISITNLTKANDNLRNNYEARENVIEMLRENNRQLEEENTELKLLRSVDTRTSIDRLLHSDGESYCTIHDSPYTIFNDSNHQDSLYDELKASGIANMCSWNDTISRELKKEVQWYELEIHKLIQLTESVFQQLVLAQNEKCVNFKQNVIESSEKMNNLEILRQRIQILLDTVNARLETDIQIPIQNSGTRINMCDLSTLNSNEDHVECFLKKDQIIMSYDDISNEKQDPKVVMVSETSNIDPIIQIFHQNVRPVTSSHPSPIKNSTENVSLISLEKSITLCTSTMCQDTPNDASKIKNDIFGHSNKDYSDTIARICPDKSSPNGNNMKENEKLQFMDHISLPINFPATFQSVTIECNRKSKSESSLLPKKKVLSSRSFNVIIPLSATEKMNEAIEIRKSSGNSTCEETEKENKFQTEFKEKDAENLTNSHEYKFGGTYRSLNDSSDSSVSSSSIRSENLLLEDFSLDGLEHSLYEFKRPVLMAPTKLKLLLHKVTSLDDENQMSDSKENFHELLDLQNGTECRNNLVKKIKRKNLEVCKIGSFNLTKSNIRNDKEIDKEIDKETGLRNCLFHYLKNILTPSSWRVLISYLLVFFFGFYAMSGFLSTSINVGPPYKWWSLEEILNQYFPIVNMRFPPLL